MGIYTEKREQLIEKIEFYKKRIADDTAKKKTAEEKLRASGLTDEYLLELVGGKNADNSISYPDKNEDDDISFYDNLDGDEG